MAKTFSPEQYLVFMDKLQEEIADENITIERSRLGETSQYSGETLVIGIGKRDGFEKHFAIELTDELDGSDPKALAEAAAEQLKLRFSRVSSEDAE